MIKLLVTLILSLGPLNVMAGGDKGNGADPYIAYAKAFPEPQKITDAALLVEEKVSNSNLPEDLKKDIISETQSLERNDRFRYLGNVIVLPGANEEFGHKVPSEEGEFLGLGSFTIDEKGAQVYFTERTLEYNEVKFAKLMLHEVLHHFLSQHLNNDEFYIERLVEQIWSGNVSKILLKSLEIGYYLPKDKLTKKRLFLAFAITMNTNKNLIPDSDERKYYGIRGMSRDAFNNNCNRRSIEKCYNYLNEEGRHLPENLQDLAMNDDRLISFYKKLFSTLALAFGHDQLDSIFHLQGYHLEKHWCEEYTGFLFKSCVKSKTIYEVIKERK